MRKVGKSVAQKNKKSNKVIAVVVGLLIIISTAALTLGLFKHFSEPFVEEKPVVSDERINRDEEKPEGEWIVPADEPRYMSIDKLGIINARVVGLGVKAGTVNQLDDPKNIHDVGWYNKSVKPGFGSTTGMAGLYDGHNTGYSEDGVFINLGKLTTGDLVRIERGDGQIFNFEVRTVRTVPLAEVDMSIMHKSVESEVEGLNIISCGGSWDDTAQTYTHRVIVRAVLSV